MLYDIEQDLILNEILNINSLLDGRIVIAPRNPLDDNNKNNNDDDDRGKKTKLFAVYAGATSYSHCVLVIVSRDRRYFSFKLHNN